MPLWILVLALQSVIPSGPYTYITPSAKMATRDLSVVLYGASGFTGRLVAHYLAARGGVGRIGLAGRSRQKLEAVAAETARPGWEPDVLVAEADDHAALSALAARTRVVLSTAGPYALCGTPLVAACLAAGTDYVDINGEVPWMRSLIDRFDSEAARADVRIVPSCGYTVPSDLGTLATVQAMQRRFGEDVRSVLSTRTHAPQVHCVHTACTLQCACTCTCTCTCACTCHARVVHMPGAFGAELHALQRPAERRHHGHGHPPRRSDRRRAGMRTACARHPHSMCTASAQHVHGIRTARAQHAHIMRTSCAPHARACA